MDYVYAALLGLLQGLTEFLPVSSSGHLVIAQQALGLSESQGILSSLAFDIVLHLGTLLAVLVYFRARILSLLRSLTDRTLVAERRMIVYVIVGTIPAVFAGLFIKSHLGGVYQSVTFASFMLLINGTMLLSTGLIKTDVKAILLGETTSPGEAISPKKTITLKSCLWVGVAQACAILPGISRSGSTISMGMFLKVTPERAAEFSFLLAIPAILGAAVLELKDLSGVATDNFGVFLVGAVVAFVSGLIAVNWLMRLIGKGQFKYFGVYCLLVGSLAFFFI